MDLNTIIDNPISYTMTEQLQDSRLKTLNAAIHIYTTDRTRFTAEILVEDAKVSRDEFDQCFESKYAVIRYYYEWAISQYEAMVSEIRDFDEFTASEKISNFLYTLFDILDEQEPFVRKTYRRFIYHAVFKTEFQLRIERLYQSFIENDRHIPSFNKNVAGTPLHIILARTSMWIFSYRLDDDSPQKERTLALVDKITALLNEILTTSIPDRTIDLISFLGSNNKLISQFPFSDSIGHFFAKILSNE